MLVELGLEDKYYCTRSEHEIGSNHYKTCKDSYSIRVSIPTVLALNDYENIHQLPFLFYSNYFMIVEIIITQEMKSS